MIVTTPWVASRDVSLHCQVSDVTGMVSVFCRSESIVSHHRFDSIKSDGNIVAADQFFLSHVDCDNKVRWKYFTCWLRTKIFWSDRAWYACFVLQEEIIRLENQQQALLFSDNQTVCPQEISSVSRQGNKWFSIMWHDDPLSKAIVALTPIEAVTIHVYDSRDIYKLRTTAIPSHHCPGKGIGQSEHNIH